MKNKGLLILLIALAVLSLVVLVALFFFYPKDSGPRNLGTGTPEAGLTSGNPEASTAPNEFDPVEWTRNPETSGLTSTTLGQANDLVVTLPSLPSAALPNTALPTSPGAAFPEAGSEGSPTTTVRTVAVAKPRVEATKPALRPKANAQPFTEYWIQVGSYRDRFQAESKSKALESQGLKGTLTTAQVEGKSVVRVRVGPYASSEEAAKFLAWIKPVEGFEASFVTQVKGHR